MKKFNHYSIFSFFGKTKQGSSKRVVFPVLFLLLSVCGKAIAQCPPAGAVSLQSQVDVNTFGANYPNCTLISGDLIISGSDITSLSPLSSLTKIEGFLTINNTDLTHLDGLSNLTEIDGSLNISFNNSLTDISGIENIDYTTTAGLSIYFNAELSECSLTNICSLLTDSEYFNLKYISGNTGNCSDNTAVISACPAPCPTGNYEFYTQADINNFGAMYAHCTNIELNNVWIQDDNITNLNGLSNITSVTGGVNIGGIYAYNLNGLHNIQTIGGDLSISYSPALQTVNFDALQSVGGALDIYYNPQLVSVAGLSGLETVGGQLTIHNNDWLGNLNGLENLTAIGDRLRIINNPALTDIYALQNIDPATIGGDGLAIMNNTDLWVCYLPNFCTYLSNPEETHPRTISGNAGGCSESNIVYRCSIPCPTSSDNFTFSTQEEIDDFRITYLHCMDITLGNVTIAGSNIANLDGLINGGLLYVDDGLSKIKHITGDLWISGNDLLPNLDGLENLQTIGGKLYIEQNDVLTDMSGLSGLQSIGTSFILYMNPQLTTISGLDNLTTVGTDFHIDSNAALTNLNGLSHLTQIGGQLYIKGNSVLNDISGLANIHPETIGGTYGLYIVNNIALLVCNLLNFCSYLSDETHPRTISGNAEDCISEQAVSDACSLICASLGDYTFFTQAQIDDFGIDYSFCDNINNVHIEGADITNLDGLNNITTIGGNLVISNNPQLQNLDGLNNITTVGGGIFITQNAQLTDISGLANIDPESIENLVITDNMALSVCNLINICIYLADQTNLRTINNNAGDCITEQAATAICTAPCNMGNFFFTTQQQVDDFGIAYPYCNDITLVQLRIGNGDITNLDGLSKIKTVTEELIMWDSNQLTDINGLSSLESIGGYLWIHNASQLTNLDGFSSLQTVGNFNIQNNNALADISGLSGLTSTREVLIYNNPLLTNLDALSGLVTIEGSIGISENDSLIDISGLQNIDPETIKHLTIRNNTDLSVCNLPNFCIYLSDETNPRIISGNAGFCLDEQDVKYHCLSCPTPEDDFTLNNQQQIDTFGEMYLHCDDIVLRNLIISGGDITNLDGLSHITGVTGNLTIQYTQLTDLNVFSNFTGIGGNLTIAGNSLLTTLDGLSNITTVEGNLDIGYNSLLINIDGLANLTGIAGGIHIFNHPILTNISGLANIDSATITGLKIENNPQLSACNLPNFCTYLSDENNTRTISGNLANCLDEAAVTAACPAACPTGDYFFYSQAEIDDFGAMYAHCTDITLNNVTISNTGITNLDGLSGLVNVEGYLNLNNLNTLTNTDGLSNLTTVGEYLWLQSINSTSTAMNLSSLTSVGEELHIQNNSALTQIDLSSLTSVGGELRITNNSALTAIDLSVLTTFPAYININDNNVLANLDVSNLTTVGGLAIHNSPALTNLNTLSNLTVVGSGGLSINTNTALTDIDGLSNLTTVEGNLGIISIPSLTHLDALSNLTTLGGILEIGLPQLTNLDGLSGLTSTGGINFSTNPLLTDIDGLSNITTLGGYLRINDVDALTNLDGLNGLTSIGGRIEITRNALLANLNGLSNVASVQGEIRIGGFVSGIGNPQLTDISGLQNINPEGITDLYIRYNTNLLVCNLANFCTYLSDENNTRTIQNNAGDCISSQAIEAACAGNCDSYTVWDGISWSGGEPDSTKKAIIEGELTLTSDLESCELEVTANGSLTIPSGNSLTVNGIIKNSSLIGAEGFIVRSGGNLIQTSTYESDANLGQITVERESQEVVRLDYTMWSSPVKEQGLKAFSPGTIWNRIYTYETTAENSATDGSYVEVFSSSSAPDENFENGKGYLYRAPNNWNILHDNQPVAYLGEFIGEPFNGNLSVPTYPEGYTSVGNPYPSNIDPALFLTANPEISTLYFWNNPERIFNEMTQAWEYTGTKYVTFSAAGFVPFEYEGNSITVGQGFIVKTSGESVSFSNAMRGAGAGSFFRNPTEKHRFWLSLSDGDAPYNQLMVSYMHGATNGADEQIDGKQFGYSGSSLYNIIDEEAYTIQGRALPLSLSDVVPLGFRAAEGGKFVISLAGFDGLFSEGEVIIYLKDKDLNTIHNLMDSDYAFESKQGEYKERFEVVYRKQAQISEQASLLNDIRIQKKDHYIFIESDIDKILKVEVYNIHGRIVHSNKNVNAKQYKISSALLGKQIIIVTAQAENGEIVTKKIINK